MTIRHGNTLTLRLIAFVFPCLFWATSTPVLAQTTNLEAYQTLATQCLAAVPDTVQALRLDAPGQMPYLRTALVERWQQQNKLLFLADTTLQQTSPPPPRLRYEIEQAQVSYARADRKALTRTVTLALRYTFIASDGRLLRDDRCQDTYSDTIPRKARAAVETEAFPETQAEAPAGSWRRRFLEPALLAAATAVTIFLFFNLRSDRADDV